MFRATLPIFRELEHIPPKRRYQPIFLHGVKSQKLFYIRGSVRRNSRLKKPSRMQLYADIYLLLNYSTCFGRQSRPSSGVNKTVVASSGTDHTIWGASFLKRDQIRTPDDGRDGRPKHVE